MKINTRARYAIRLMADVTKYSAGNPVPLKDVARRQNLSKRYLSQLTIPLRNASLLRSVWGNNGGYMLARAPGEIRILDIIEAVEGPVSILDCISDPMVCDRYDYCECIRMWQDINEGIINTLSRYTLKDLLAKGGTGGSAADECVFDVRP